jgi:hypothetical protein
VTLHRGCLGSLPAGERQVLELRGGTNGRPQSRGATARQLGISTRETALREHRGLRALRHGCGASGSGVGSDSSASTLAASGAPALQPAVMFSDAPAFRRTADMRQGHQGVLGETASGTEDSSTRSQYASVVPGTSLQPVAGDASSAPLIWIPVLLLLALVTAGLIATRRRGAAQPAAVGNGAYVTPVVAAPASAPAAAEPEAEAAPEPETAAITEAAPVEGPATAPPDWQWPSPSAPEHPDTAHRIAERARRPAAAAAAGVVGVLVRELLKRRRK